MKNILFWAGLIVATFWDEVLLASIKTEKTKRQQQFLQSGETAQYFIGAVPNTISVLKKIFSLKVYKPDTGSKYDDLIYPSETLYQFNGGPAKNGFNVIMNNRYTQFEIHFPSEYGADSYSKYYGANVEVDIDTAYDDEQLYMIIWFAYIEKLSKSKLEKIPNFESIRQLVDNYENLELAFILLSGVPNIKKILA